MYLLILAAVIILSLILIVLGLLAIFMSPWLGTALFGWLFLTGGAAGLRIGRLSVIDAGRALSNLSISTSLNVLLLFALSSDIHAVLRARPARSMMLMTCRRSNPGAAAGGASIALVTPLNEPLRPSPSSDLTYVARPRKDPGFGSTCSLTPISVPFGA